VIVVLLAVLAAIPLAGYYLYFKPNDEVVPAFAEGELVLVVEGEKVLSKNSPKILEGEVLLPFDIVKNILTLIFSGTKLWAKSP